ncbi:MAG: cyclic nucleotide-binding domain-containing protein, partial [Nitrospinota bacterium]|nr:cyclic nucleotide-binding domain-containing protein [Nitrospinota bacterium]
MIKLETVVVRYFDGDFLIKQGDSDIRLFILLAGNVNVVKEEDTSKVLAQLKRGDLFGEVFFISRRPRTANVITVGEVIVIRIDGDQFHTLPHVIESKIQEQLVDLLVQRLDNMNNNILPFLR